MGPLSPPLPGPVSPGPLSLSSLSDLDRAGPDVLPPPPPPNVTAWSGQNTLTQTEKDRL